MQHIISPLHHVVVIWNQRNHSFNWQQAKHSQRWPAHVSPTADTQPNFFQLCQNCVFFVSIFHQTTIVILSFCGPIKCLSFIHDLLLASSGHFVFLHIANTTMIFCSIWTQNDMSECQCQVLSECLSFNPSCVTITKSSNFLFPQQPYDLCQASWSTVDC